MQTYETLTDARQAAGQNSDAQAIIEIDHSTDGTCDLDAGTVITSNDARLVYTAFNATVMIRASMSHVADIPPMDMLDGHPLMCWSYQCIADVSGIGVEKVPAVLAELERAGLVRVLRRSYSKMELLDENNTGRRR